MRYLKILLSILIMLFLINCNGKVDGKDEKGKNINSSSDTKIGKTLQLPDFSLTDLEGREYTLSDSVGGKPILMVFWTTNCPYCIKEIPRLNQIYSSRQDVVDLVSINIMQPPQMVRHFVNSRGVKYPVLIDQRGETAISYRIRGVPSFVVVDIKGSMRYYGNSLDDAMKKIEGIS